MRSQRLSQSRASLESGVRSQESLAPPLHRNGEGAGGWGRSGAVLVLTLVLLVACQPKSSLPVLFQAPDWSLTDQTGRPFASSNLAGRVVLADFVYTTCTDVCPLLSGSFSTVRDQLRQAGLLSDKAVLVSFTVDPDHDTPDVLNEYGGRFGAVPAEWRFLTGDRATLEDLLLAGFKLGRPQIGARRADGSTELVHTSRVALIDQRGQIRALYDGDTLDPSAVVEEIRRLAS
jgi:cytochrome oxidase Cu insertion factor (SCO1/SenC/PrrC family)